MDIEKVPLKKINEKEKEDDSSDEEEVIGNLKLDMTEDKGKVRGDVPLIPADDEVSISMGGSTQEEEEIDEDQMMMEELGESRKPAKKGKDFPFEVVDTGSTTSKTSSKKHLALTADEELSEEDLREKKKQDIIWWFSRVQKNKHKFPNISIPEVSDLDELETLEKQKNLITKHINADRSIVTWRKVLVASFFLIEFGGTEYLRIDMTGYADEQIASLDDYDELLVELGDGGMLHWLEGWPPWAKLLLMIGWNTVIFIVTRTLARKIGMSEKGLKSMAKSFFGKGEGKKQKIEKEEEEEERSDGEDEPKMKGPSIRVSKTRKD